MVIFYTFNRPTTDCRLTMCNVMWLWIELRARSISNSTEIVPLFLWCHKGIFRHPCVRKKSSKWMRGIWGLLCAPIARNLERIHRHSARPPSSSPRNKHSFLTLIFHRVRHSLSTVLAYHVEYDQFRSFFLCITSRVVSLASSKQKRGRDVTGFIRVCVCVYLQ